MSRPILDPSRGHARQLPGTGWARERTVILVRELQLPEPGENEQRDQHDQHDQGRASHAGEAIGSARGSSRRGESSLGALSHAGHRGRELVRMTQRGPEIDLQRHRPVVLRSGEVFEEPVEVEDAVPRR